MKNVYKITSSKEYNSVDILKLILAILIMMIHSGLDKMIISPLLRIAVPLFFIISSYFFFSKCERIESQKEKKSALLHLVKRNLFLYLFWAVIQLPIRMYVCGYFKNFKSGIWYVLKDILSGNAFTGSWYIMALVIGVIIIFYLSKKISAGWLICITFPLYIICCCITNYRNLFDANSIIVTISDGYYNFTGLYFYTSFPVALFWVSVGNYLAKNKVLFKNNFLFLICVFFCLLLALERFLIIKNSLSITDDCYFMLVLLCPTIFLLVSRCKTSFNSKFQIREISVIIYVTHGSCGRLVGYLLKKIPVVFLKNEILKIFITFLTIMFISYFILYFKDKLGSKLFKYIC